jgi:hypothetical protein
MLVLFLFSLLGSLSLLVDCLAGANNGGCAGACHRDGFCGEFECDRVRSFSDRQQQQQSGRKSDWFQFRMWHGDAMVSLCVYICMHVCMCVCHPIYRYVCVGNDACVCECVIHIYIYIYMLARMPVVV